MPHHKNNTVLSTDYVKIFVQLVEGKGVLAKDILANTGLDPHQLNKEPYINLQQLSQLIDNSSLLLNDVDWGLEFGQRLHIGAHGLLGHVSTSANDGFESLKTYQQFLKIRNQLVSIEVQLKSSSVVILFDLHMNLGNNNRALIDGCISGFMTTLSTKFQLHSIDIPIHLSYPQPPNIELHHQIMGNNILFSSSQNSVELPLSLLTQLNASANPGVFQLVKKQSEAALVQVTKKTSLPDTVSGYLLENPEALLTQELMAKKLNMTPRTLRRKLQEEGVNYQQLQNTVRKNIAIRYLLDTSWSVQEISDRLGYSEEVNFSRAFKRWVGVTPSLYRKQC